MENKEENINIRLPKGMKGDIRKYLGTNISKVLRNQLDKSIKSKRGEVFRCKRCNKEDTDITEFFCIKSLYLDIDEPYVEEKFKEDDKRRAAGFADYDLINLCEECFNYIISIPWKKFVNKKGEWKEELNEDSKKFDIALCMDKYYLLCIRVDFNDDNFPDKSPNIMLKLIMEDRMHEVVDNEYYSMILDRRRNIILPLFAKYLPQYVKQTDKITKFRWPNLSTEEINQLMRDSIETMGKQGEFRGLG